MKKRNNGVEWWLNLILVIVVVFLAIQAIEKHIIILGFCAIGVAACTVTLNVIYGNLDE